MCKPEVSEMSNKVGNLLIGYAYKVKAGPRDIRDLKYWADSARVNKARRQNSINVLTFPWHRLAKPRWRLP
jgi:hypothetical protein